MVALLTTIRASPFFGSPVGRQRGKSAVVGLLALGVLIAVDEVVVRSLSDATYLELYLTYGALANLVIVVFTLAWSDKLERHASLISAHPLEYLGGHVGLGTALGVAFSAAVSPGRGQYKAMLDAQARAKEALGEDNPQLREAAANPALAQSPVLANLTQRLVEAEAAFRSSLRDLDLPWIPIGLGFLDFVITMTIALVLALGMLAWLVFVMPAQYFVYLLAGAPAREALGSPRRALVRVTRGQIEAVRIPKQEPIPAGYSESGISARPVTLTASLAAIMLFTLSRLLT
jgi:hypothetical protein